MKRGGTDIEKRPMKECDREIEAWMEPQTEREARAAAAGGERERKKRASEGALPGRSFLSRGRTAS